MGDSNSCIHKPCIPPTSTVDEALCINEKWNWYHFEMVMEIFSMLVFNKIPTKELLGTHLHFLLLLICCMHIFNTVELWFVWKILLFSLTSPFPSLFIWGCYYPVYKLSSLAGLPYFISGLKFCVFGSLFCQYWILKNLATREALCLTATAKIHFQVSNCAIEIWSL